MVGLALNRDLELFDLAGDGVDAGHEIDVVFGEPHRTVAGRAASAASVIVHHDEPDALVLVKSSSVARGMRHLQAFW
jgi:hypothetical protein